MEKEYGLCDCKWPLVKEGSNICERCGKELRYHRLAGFIVAVIFLILLIWLWNWSGRVTKQIFDEEAKRTLMGPGERKWYDTQKKYERELRDREWARKRLQK